jgi:GT2 family glycosyltransferase
MSMGRHWNRQLPTSVGSSTFHSDATTRPEVSIGLPVYNSERYLAGAIASILDQTYRNFELIICDNASTDATPAICRGFAANEERIRYYRQPHNLGAAANFNHCVDLAQESTSNGPPTMTCWSRAFSSFA